MIRPQPVPQQPVKPLSCLLPVALILVATALKTIGLLIDFDLECVFWIVQLNLRQPGGEAILRASQGHERKGVGIDLESALTTSDEVVMNDWVRVKRDFFGAGFEALLDDLTVEGRVEGKIELKGHNLWIGPQGKVYAEIHAKSVIIAGEVIGNIFASEMVEIRLSGSVLGNIKCPRISILDGAKFNGSIDTDTGLGTAPKLQKADSAKMSHGSSLGQLFSRF